MKRATYEDVLSAPEHRVAEILDGELFDRARKLELGRLWAGPPAQP